MDCGGKKASLSDCSSSSARSIKFDTNSSKRAVKDAGTETGLLHVFSCVLCRPSRGLWVELLKFLWRTRLFSLARVRPERVLADRVVHKWFERVEHLVPFFKYSKDLQGET